MAGKIMKAHCNRCLSQTNHIVLFEDERNWTEEDENGQFSFSEANAYFMLRCAGCDETHYEHHHSFSEETDERGAPIEHRDHYPATVIRQKPQWRRDFIYYFNWKLSELGQLLDEVYDAYAVGSHRLAVMGIRALAERVMIDQVGDQGSFEANIKKFCDEGFVARIQVSLFRDTLIESGHAAMHRNFKPDAKVVSTLLDIIEGIVDVIYYQPLKADEVRKGIPGRATLEPPL